VGRRLVPNGWLVDLLVLLLAGLLIGATALCGLVSVTRVPTRNPIATDLWIRGNHEAEVNGYEIWHGEPCCQEVQ